MQQREDETTSVQEFINQCNKTFKKEKTQKPITQNINLILVFISSSLRFSSNAAVAVSQRNNNHKRNEFVFFRDESQKKR